MKERKKEESKMKRSARKIIEEYVEKPSDQEDSIADEEQEIIEATSRHSKSISAERSATPNKKLDNSNLIGGFPSNNNTSVTPTNLSLNLGMPKNNISAYLYQNN